MLLETGGGTRFQVRPVEGVDLAPNTAPDELTLDGQQRLTSLTQVLKLDKPVATRDEKKRELRLHYYFNIEKALEGPEALEGAIVAVDEGRTRRTNFGRDVTLDLSSREKEIDAFHFPCSQIMNSDDWEQALSEHAPEMLARFMKFRRQVVEPFRNYALPVISLKKETSKEAVCLVFEKVNTGGVPLSVFELITATWAADGFNLREDWFGGTGKSGRQARLSKKALFRDNETDTIRPATEYRDNTKFAFIEPFETTQHQFRDIRRPAGVTGIQISTEDVFEGQSSALIMLDTAKQFVELATLNKYRDLMKTGAYVYLEVNYKSEVPLIFGVVGHLDIGGIGSTSALFEPGFLPKDEWNKIYFNLTEMIFEGDFDAYQIVFQAFIPSENSKPTLNSAKVWLDNIKLVYF